jgi:DNA-binding NarL/FixJ family response regulator
MKPFRGVFPHPFRPRFFGTAIAVNAKAAKKTKRDKKILRFVFQGLTNKEIGSRLEISEGAVKFSLRQLCEKLGVRMRAQLVKVALEQYRDQL